MCELDNPGFLGYLWKNLHSQLDNSLALNDVLENWTNNILCVMSLG